MASGAELSYKTVRSTYLVTYSRADVIKFPTKSSFAEAVLQCFPDREKAKVVMWACSLETHKDGMPHYHMCMKFSGNRRWKEGKNLFYRTHGVSLHFSSLHNDYATAFEYVAKEDEDVLKSPSHPPLCSFASTKTRRALAAVRTETLKRQHEKNEQGASTSQVAKKKKRITVGMVSEFIIKNNIHTEKAIYEAIHLQKKEGQGELNEFILSRPSKFIEDLLHRSWKIENAMASKKREDTTRMEIVTNALHTECKEGCSGQWLACAKEVLTNNKINPYVFADAIRSAISCGRKKGNNIMLVGPGDCAKTFLLLPLTVVFDAFTNPAKATFAWVGVDGKEAIFLNDIRWSEKMIEWGAFLNLLDGNEVRFPRPKNFHNSDIVMTREEKVPIFATSIAKIKYEGENAKIESEMMDARWKIFPMFHQIPKANQKHLEPCARCFAEMTMMGSEFEF